MQNYIPIIYALFFSSLIIYIYIDSFLIFRNHEKKWEKYQEELWKEYEEFYNSIMNK